MFGEPVVFLINLYIALMYAIMYLWFEVFPIVFVEIHGFNLIQTGIDYVSIMVSVFLGTAGYLPAIYKVFIVPMERGEWQQPEIFIPTSIVGAIFQPMCLHLCMACHSIGPLDWSARWRHSLRSAPSSASKPCSTTLPSPSLDTKPLSSPETASSEQALPRPSLFANTLYKNLGTKDFPVGWGCSILGFINLDMIGIPILLYANGVKLRARSKYSN
jgi:DHA1 family multidrug resistance protein-like MFS transporter